MKRFRFLLGRAWTPARIGTWLVGLAAGMAVLVWSAAGVNLSIPELVRGMP